MFSPLETLVPRWKLCYQSWKLKDNAWPFCPIAWCLVRRSPRLFSREQSLPKFCFSDFHTELPPTSICLTHPGVGNACTISPDTSCSQQHLHTAPSASQLETAGSPHSKERGRERWGLLTLWSHPVVTLQENPVQAQGSFTLHTYLFGLHQAGEDADLASREPEGWREMRPALPSHSQKKNK